MSQNKTVYPGVGADVNSNFNQGQNAHHPNDNAFFHSHQNYRGTFYPGMEISPSGSSETFKESMQNPENNRRKPIVGFLYSISKTGLGEYWPLYVGQNIIGNSETCNIVLGEGTVSHTHANLHINMMRKPEKIEATILDMGSTNGTLVNQNSVSVLRPVECFNGDVITIGQNYDLLLLLIDTKTIGLHTSSTFINLEEEPEAPIDSIDNNPDFPPHFRPTDPNAYSPSYDGTMGMDNSGGFKKGGTVDMTK